MSDPAALHDAIETFFRRPEEPLVEGIVSTLFLCRRELQDCLVGKIVTEEDLLSYGHHRLFASALVILAGLDLLATMAPPPPEASRRNRFIHFVVIHSRQAALPVTSEQADALWNFRNALSHTFGFFHLSDEGAVVPMWLYDQNSPAPVAQRRGEGWEFCLDSLAEVFLVAIRQFRQNLDTDTTTAEYFLYAYQRYGTIHWRGPHIA